MNPDRLAELEEERRFLLRSIVDLDREHAAGDVDEADYLELRDGYTVRAAATLRAIEEGRAALPDRRRADWRRRAAAALAAGAAVAVVAWALIESSAERSPSAQITGSSPDEQFQVLMAQARVASQQSPGDAAALYAEALEQRPDDPEALTYFGWTLALDARRRVDELGEAAVAQRIEQAAEVLTAATRLDPAYADPQCFLGVLTFRNLGDPAGALGWIDGCLAANPPADVRGLVENLRGEVAAALDAGSDVDATG